jgi:hypothetical protein
VPPGATALDGGIQAVIVTVGFLQVVVDRVYHREFLALPAQGILHSAAPLGAKTPAFQTLAKIFLGDV